MFKRVQRGRGRGFARRVQRGRGIGGILSSIFRVFSRAAPIAAKIASNPTARKLGKEVLKSGLRIGGEAMMTNNLNSALKNELSGVKQRIGRAALKRAGDLSSPHPKKTKKGRAMRKTQTGRGKKNKLKTTKTVKAKRKTKVKKTRKNVTGKSSLDQARKKKTKKSGDRRMSNIFAMGQRGSGNPIIRPKQRPTIFDM